MKGNAASNGTNFSPGGKSGKRLIAAGLLVTVLISALLLGTLSCVPGSASGKTSGPSIQFDSDVIDLGTAAPGDDLEAVFVFRNAGNETLVIEQIDTKSVTEGC
jgi:hypothetical protein